MEKEKCTQCQFEELSIQSITFKNGIQYIQARCRNCNAVSSFSQRSLSNSSLSKEQIKEQMLIELIQASVEMLEAYPPDCHRNPIRQRLQKAIKEVLENSIFLLS